VTRGAVRVVALALLAALGACAAVHRGRHLVLRWPAVVVPAGVTDVRYEVAVWALDREVPTTKLLHRQGVSGNALRVDADGWPAELCWSVRAHWREGGRPRQSRWLAANGEPVVAAELPSRELRREERAGP
jgi:hypothetical protein